MICYLHYISSKRRLAESQKTVIMLGGEQEAPEMVRAQRDYIAMELEYYSEQCIDWNFILLIAAVIGGSGWFIYKLTHGG